MPRYNVSIYGETDRCSLLEFESLEFELRLDDARRLDPGPEHVLLRGHVVGAADAVEGVQIVGGAVVELQGGDSIGNFRLEFWLLKLALDSILIDSETRLNYKF